jgi:hypothetical protein
VGISAAVDLTEDRIAQNQSTFRDANERIEEAAQNESFTIAGKAGPMGEVAAQLDPRSDAQASSTG